MREYDKYKMGDIHWQWYYNTPEYYDLVNESLIPFKENTELGSVVDIGCGDGLSLSFLDEWGYKCFGVDPSKTGIDLALEHNVSAEYFIEKAEKFKDRDIKFDYLYSMNTIEHLDDPQAMVEIMKKIKNYGVIITDWHGKHPDKKDSYHNIEFTPDSFKELFKDFNLTELSLSSPRYFGFIVRNKV
jgi:SAM-dependent methyltransferase